MDGWATPSQVSLCTQVWVLDMRDVVLLVCPSVHCLMDMPNILLCLDCTVVGHLQAPHTAGVSPHAHWSQSFSQSKRWDEEEKRGEGFAIC